jgi:hypothetical protein
MVGPMVVISYSNDPTACEVMILLLSTLVLTLIVMTLLHVKTGIFHDQFGTVLYLVTYL